ncbi:MAG: hypothetical protein RMI34_07810 [Chloroherpetonaceae bacterium]|nr:hypothetical protein [Chloroherpetonaceae bacterium]MCS7211220.1 hypothetical protein [Chloroherpetonaceae bacterium]MDW8019965.1 hypothetical protein [Chloroherpetonaceae bacterium]
MWLKVEKGVVLYLDPYQQKWQPASSKEEIPLKTFVLTKDGAKARLFKETEDYVLPESSYFFVEDVIPKSRVEVVAALTQIEAEQLPKSTREPRERRPIGLTYGDPMPDTTTSNIDAIPYLAERRRAVQHFIEMKRYDAALLSQKRLLTKFPALYQYADEAERLFMLYDKLELYGFLNDETRRLMAIKRSVEFDKMLEKWNQLAKSKLLNRP